MQLLANSDKDKEKLKKIAEDRKEIVRANTHDYEKSAANAGGLGKWKAEVITLWKTMNEWVYKGFDETYKRIGSDFDKIYYESETYLLGRKFVEEGLAERRFL